MVGVLIIIILVIEDVKYLYKRKLVYRVFITFTLKFSSDISYTLVSFRESEVTPKSPSWYSLITGPVLDTLIVLVSGPPYLSWNTRYTLLELSYTLTIYYLLLQILRSFLCGCLGTFDGILVVLQYLSIIVPSLYKSTRKMY